MFNTLISSFSVARRDVTEAAPGVAALLLLGGGVGTLFGLKKAVPSFVLLALLALCGAGAAAVERLSQSLTIAAPTVSQVAGLAAFDCTDELDQNVERYRRNRDIVLEGLIEAGLTRMAPADGAFYAWVDVSDLGLDSQTLCARWLDEIGVAATPGIDFDQGDGHRFVRFSYAGDPDEMSEAMSRIKTWVEAHRQDPAVSDQ